MLIVGFVVIQTIVFGVIFLVLRKMLLKDTTSAVNRLKIVDEENAKRLEEIKAKIQEAEAEYKRKLEELAAELEKQREEAKKQTEEEKTRVLAKAREDGDRILETSKSRADKVDQEIEKAVQGRAVELARTIAEKALSVTMQSVLHEKLVEELLREVEALDVGHIPDETREVEIVQPQPLSDDLKKRIRQILEKKLGRKLEIKETIKTDMGSGLSLKIGSLVLDGSLQNVLDGVARELKKRE